MKATGIVRRIDDLGRVVIPKEIRRTLRIKEGTPLEIFTDREGEIILKKYSPIGELSLFAKEYAESLSQATGMLSCITDHDQVVAAAGPGSKEFIGKLISSQLEAVINDREAKCLSARDRGKVPVVDEQPGHPAHHSRRRCYWQCHPHGKNRQRHSKHQRKASGADCCRVSWTADGTIILLSLQSTSR